MNPVSQYFAARRSDPAVDLIARTTAAVRADPGFMQRPNDWSGGVALSDEAPQALASGALAAAMSRIDQAQVLDASAADRARHGGRIAELSALPSPVREAAFAALETERWRFGGFGIRRLPLGIADDAFVELMRIEPGRGVPHHDHADDEVTLILTGGYHDGHNHYGPGDISMAQPGFVHTPKADPGEVCYVLAVSYGPPKLAGLYRIWQHILAEPADARAVWRTR